MRFDSNLSLLLLVGAGVTRQSTSSLLPSGNQIGIIDNAELDRLGCGICDFEPYKSPFGFKHTCACTGPWLFVGARKKANIFGSKTFLVGGFGYRGDGPFPVEEADSICRAYDTGADVSNNGVQWALNYKGTVGIRLNDTVKLEILHWDISPDKITDWEQIPHIYKDVATDNEYLEKSVWNCPREPTSSPTRTPSPSSSMPTYPPTTDPSIMPTNSPTTDPPVMPTYPPTTDPSIVPTKSPSTDRPVMPTSSLTANPSAMPTPPPNDERLCNPSIKPTKRRKRNRSKKPTSRRTTCPSRKPSRCYKTKPDTSTSLWSLH